VRGAFIETLNELAADNDRIWLVCGDLGYSVLESFARRYPDRYVNAGVAEQNMTGIAAGLALAGNIAVTYSIANFPVMRCLEQVRNDVCYHRVNVKIVAVGGGLAYGPAGYTHHGIEDLAIMRVMPNMTVLAPADPVETRLATRAMMEWDGPCYLRLGKAGEAVVHTGSPQFRIGRAIPVRDGVDVSLISTGGTLRLALDAAEVLSRENIDCAVISMPTVQPVDAEAVAQAAARTGRIVTIEEHGRGGLASAVLEALSASAVWPRFAAVHLNGAPATTAGSQEQLRTAAGVSIAHVVAKVKSLAGTSP
jgi:transketolase